VLRHSADGWFEQGGGRHHPEARRCPLRRSTSRIALLGNSRSRQLAGRFHRGTKC
jgi:hypothetical protein